MKNIRKYIGFAAVGLMTAVSVSCTMESPFGETQKGMGALHLTTDIKGETVTRAEIGVDEMKSLRERAIVYIERKNSNANRHEVIRKYFGLESIPGDIALSKGQTYLAEGWTGDSVSASFDAKFYRGKTEEFHVEEQTSVILKLNIANVLVSFAPETFELGLSDLTMTVKHSRGELIFSESAEGGSTIFNTGYFMMPSTDTSLSYEISAKTSAGETITREGTIENVQRAHQYQIRLKGNESPEFGAGLIRIEIEDIPVIEEEIEIFGKPVVEGREFDLESQIVGTPGEFNEKIVYVCGYKGLSSLTLGGADAPEVVKNLESEDLTKNVDAWEAIGIHVDPSISVDAETGVTLDRYDIFFRKEFFDNLPVRDEEYRIDITAIDRSGKRTTGTMRIANSEAAIVVQVPVESAPVPDAEYQPMAITGSQASLTGYLYNFDVEDYGIEYRESGSSAWTKVSGKQGGNDVRRKGRSLSRMELATRAAKVPFTVTIKGLKPGTTYEYRTYCDGYDNAPVQTFTTESKYIIPNASFEDWSTYSAKTMLGTKTVVLPGSTGDKNTSIWGSGNEGAATANLVLTDKSTDMKHSGTYSARLETNMAMGMVAAGNVFMGMYVETDGTNGVLSLGRPYNGSHPSKLRVWANYRPASGVTVKGGNEEFVPDGFAGGNDHGQIYVALTTEPVEVRTNPSKRKLFDSENDPTVLAYGQVTWTDNFGPEGALEQVEIPIEYKAAAKSQQAKYLVIVVSASKYGDFFSGAKGSVFYLDDFELVY